MTRARIGGAVFAVVVVVLGFVFLVRPGSTSTGVSPAAAGGGCAVRAASVPGAAESRLPVRPVCALPVQAQQTAKLIATGGPFPYSRDGIVFGNREKLLPAEKGGFYHEYTVVTPGSDDRGARRLIAGGPRGTGQELFYTDDHYASFVVVDATATS